MRRKPCSRHYIDAIDRIAGSGLDAQLSVKPTQLGLDLDPALAKRHIDQLIDRAEERSNFIWIDMESSAYVDRTVDLFRHAQRTIAARGHRAAGVSLSNRVGRHAHSSARAAHSARERRVPRALVGRLSKKVGCRRELFQAVTPGCSVTRGSAIVCGCRLRRMIAR